MRLLFTAPLFALACVAAACGALPPPATPIASPTDAAPRPVVLATVTWNMNAGRGDLSGLLADLDAGRLTATAPRHYVVLLQEASGADLERVAAAEGLSLYFARVREQGPLDRGNAILSTLPLHGGQRIALPRERQPRIAVAAHVELDGVPLFVASAHLENRVSWWRAGLFSDTARGRQARALVDALPPARPGILGGDMNTWLGVHEPAWDTFRARFPDTPRQLTGPTFRERLVLDQLFFDVPPRWVASTVVAPEAYGSDHHPVIGALRQS